MTAAEEFERNSIDWYVPCDHRTGSLQNHRVGGGHSGWGCGVCRPVPSSSHSVLRSSKDRLIVACLIAFSRHDEVVQSVVRSITPVASPSL